MRDKDRHKLIFSDACAIIEAYEMNLLNPLLNNYSIITVEKIIDECNKKIPIIKSGSSIRVVKVSELERVRIKLKLDGDLDDGELDLLAYIIEVKEDFLLCTADFAAMRAAVKFDYTDNLISLEELAKGMGINKTFRSQYTAALLDRKKTEYRLGYLK